MDASTPVKFDTAKNGWIGVSHSGLFFPQPLQPGR
jgi:hypothetical protein